jgi:hypothetical protein
MDNNMMYNFVHTSSIVQPQKTIQSPTVALHSVHLLNIIQVKKEITGYTFFKLCSDMSHKIIMAPDVGTMSHVVTGYTFWPMVCEEELAAANQGFQTSTSSMAHVARSTGGKQTFF